MSPEVPPRLDKHPEESCEMTISHQGLADAPGENIQQWGLTPLQPALGQKDSGPVSRIYKKDVQNIETMISNSGSDCFCLLLFCFFHSADQIVCKHSNAVQVGHWTGSFYLLGEKKTKKTWSPFNISHVLRFLTCFLPEESSLQFFYLTDCWYYPGDRLNDETEEETNVYFMSQFSEFSGNNTEVITRERVKIEKKYKSFIL